MTWIVGKLRIIGRAFHLHSFLALSTIRPGDFVTWRGDGEKRVAVVQSVNSTDRTTLVRWYPSPLPGEPPISLVSSLELDPVRRA
jgi:hypothetical protein